MPIRYTISLKSSLCRLMDREMNVKNQRRLSILLFLTGVVIGIVFNAMTVWAQFEASLWDQSPTEDAALDGFHCPLIITSAAPGVIRIEYKNTLDRPINPVIRTRTTKGLVTLQHEETERPDILPGETARLEYPVTASDAVWGRFIFVRVYAFPQLSLPSRDGSCGILVVKLPFLNGTFIIFLTLLASLGGMGSGIWLWRAVNQPFTERASHALRAMSFLAAVIVLGLILELFKIWGLATLMLLFTFILMAALIGYFLSSS